MKTAFSTIGCPDWGFKEIYAAAKDLGFDGIEIRGIEKDLYAPSIPFFSPEQIEKTKVMFTGALKISCLSSGACLGLGKEQDTEAVEEARAYLDLADALDVPFVRVLISAAAYPLEADLNLGLNRYRTVCDYALEKGIKALPLIETNGVLADSAVMRGFIEKTDRPNAGALWDINHPYRYFGEKVEDTAKNLGGFIKYMHVKDSHMDGGRLEYRVMGYGDMPVYDALKAAAQTGFDGYVSLEWVKRWLPDLQDPGVVFSHYYSYITYLFRMLSK